MNIRIKRVLIAFVGILIAIIFPVIGWKIGVLWTEYQHIHGCASLVPVFGASVIMSIFGFFLGGFVNGLLQPETEKINLTSFLFSLTTVTILFGILLARHDSDGDIFTCTILLILGSISWFGCRVGFARQRTRKKEYRGSPTKPSTVP
jgi:hypothetical protein